MNLREIQSLKIETRFWQWVRKCGADQCWEWTGAIANGYGIFCNKQIQYTAHRVAYMYHHRQFDLTKWDMVMHTCENRACCNPAHLYIMSASERHKKMVNDGVGNIDRGENNMMAKLKVEEVREIRSLFAGGERAQDIAKRFSVSRAEVEFIVNFSRWGWLKD